MSNEVMKIDFNKDQISLIKSQIAPKATDAELQLFLYQAKRTGLDPLTRQIYAIHRKSGNVEKMTIMTSIDGLRVIAERSGDYAGQDEPIFEERSGEPIIKATIKVYRFRGDQRYCAAVGVAYWDEYVVTKDEWVNGQKTGRKIISDMWAKMPHAMLAKVAEALALRKAYPQDLSGLYTSEEMDQAEVVTTVKVPTEPANLSNKELDAAYTVVTEPSDVDNDVLNQWAGELNKCKTTADLIKLWKENEQTLANDIIIKNMFKNRETKLKNVTGMTYQDAKENHYERS